VVCRVTRDDTQLARAGRSPEGSWYLGRGPGRGVWWCAQGACAGALSVGVLARALHAPATSADLAALRALTGPPERR
jgi:predicted RNA-binding protein YlxR (DUF448 family)